MLIIKPVQEKLAQAEYCAKCGCEYEPDCLCYAAWVDEVLVGVSQFAFSGGGKDRKYARIVSLRNTLDSDDIDALFIMGRQTMNFIDLTGFHKCVLLDTPSEDFAKKLGFDRVDGELFADLEGFFFEPCEHGKANSPR